jgi:DNA-directed RNA polymerase specialized sigma24 family protein/AraC-like DNA-binding protein
VTVPGGASAVPNVDPGAAKQQFTELYAQYWDFVRRYIWHRINVSQADLAEDLAQETFIRFWKGYVQPGKLESPDSCFGLLATIARGVLAKHFERPRNHEGAADFEDPANRWLFPVRHTYAPDSPHLAALGRDLEMAMDRMAQASQLWRDKHAESYNLRIRLSDTYHAAKGGLTEERRNAIALEADAAEAAEAELLVTFREACQRVGQLRAELEAQAGPGWSTPMPQPVFHHHAEGPQEGSVRSDLSVTRCPAGHQLDLANVHFFEDGTRRCRKCRLDVQRARVSRRAPRTGSATARKTASTDTLAKARAVLEDTANDHLELKQAAVLTGLTVSTLRRRIPDVLDARQQRRDQLPAYAKNPKLAKARTLLLDDECDLTVEEIAETVGIGFASIYRQLADVVAQRSARRRKDHSDAEAKVRAMLMDPANTMSIADIAATVGWSPTAPFRRVPDAIAARRAARREAAAATPAGVAR